MRSNMIRFAGLALAILGACSEKNEETDSPSDALRIAQLRIETQAGSIPIRAEIAETPETRARGLMFREFLDDSEGMLFVFENEKIQSFYMKNTLIPLDMIFIGSDHRIVGIVREAEPRTLKSRSVGVASKYVLEVPGGFCSKRDVHFGDTVLFDL